MSATLQEIIKLLNAQYPAAWAAPGDRTGLQVGRPDSSVSTVLVALEVSPAVVREAQGLGAQLLLTHHPLIYQSLAEVREDQPGGELISALIRAGIASVSCHTNLDVAPGGLNDYLARALELTDLEVLAETGRDHLYKLAVFVPLAYADRVREQLAEAGLGVIGRYSHCSFAVRGQGTYRPLEGARPFQGEAGQLSRAEEARLEMLAPESLLPAALARLKESHPYEEVAYDLYPLKNCRGGPGFRPHRQLAGSQAGRRGYVAGQNNFPGERREGLGRPAPGGAAPGGAGRQRWRVHLRGPGPGGPDLCHRGGAAPSGRTGEPGGFCRPRGRPLQQRSSLHGPLGRTTQGLSCGRGAESASRSGAVFPGAIRIFINRKRYHGGRTCCRS